jgi:hypothetical protein
MSTGHCHHSWLSDCSASALIREFVAENAADSSNAWVPLIEICAPTFSSDESSENCYANAAISERSEESFLSAITEGGGGRIGSSPLKKSRVCSAPCRSNEINACSPAADNRESLEHTANARLAKCISIEPWARNTKPRLKSVHVSPGPGSYSPTDAKSSVAIKFGNAINHKLPFRAGYCEENFIYHRSKAVEDKPLGTARATSFTRDKRVFQITSPESYQLARNSCSPFVGPGSYDVTSKLMSTQHSGHLIPLGPKGTDLRSFRKNRVLKHTYPSNESDAVIGSSTAMSFHVFVIFLIV